MQKDYIDGFAISGGKLFAGLCCDSGIYVSSNNGSTWTLQDDTFGEVRSIYTFGNNLFATTEFDGALLSTDDGISWENGGLDGYIEEFVVKGDSIYGGTANGTYLSTDNGLTWTYLTSDSSEAYSMAIIDSNIFEGTILGLFRYTPSNSKGKLVGVPFGISSMLGIANNLYADGGAISTDEGVTWNSAAPDPEILVGSTIVAQAGSGIVVSTNGGVNWIQSDLPSTLGYPSLVRMGKYLFVSTMRFAIGEADTDVFRSSDTGKTWSVAFDKLQPVVYGWLSVLGGNRLIYGGSSDDSHCAYYESDDFGLSWHFVDSSSIFMLPVGLCCPAPKTATQIGTILWGIDSGVLYRSTDDGTTWEFMDIYSLNDSLTDINSVVATGNNLFVCAKSGNIFLSTDTGSTWKNVNDGLLDSSISFLAVTGEYLFAANMNYSLWRRPLGDFGIAAVGQVNPLQNLLKSYPNPFSQSTQITFTSQEAGYADVSIVNMLGEEVARLFSGELDTGDHTFMWDNPTGLPNGTYECLVHMNGQVQTLPMVLLR